MRRIVDTLIVICLLVGIGLIAYPTVSDLILNFQARQQIGLNNNTVENMESAETAALFNDAFSYNVKLATGNTVVTDAFSDTSEQQNSTDEYVSLLNVNGDGIMGTISIPKISVSLPIYHTTNSTVLKKGVGHVEGTSLPVGGPSTHCALAGHRGLPSAKLFTDLNRLENGDLFYISVLGRQLCYQVNQIVIVEPTETQYLNRVPGEDYVTLVTCTPYGINTHRLLVRGTRVEAPETLVEDDAITPVPLYATFIAVISFIILLIINKTRKVN